MTLRDDSGATDERTEFAGLVRGFRGYIERLDRGGSYGVERGLAQVAPAPALAPVTADTAVPTSEPTVRSSTPSLAAIRDDLGDCQRCKLSGSRNQIVFGVGSESAALMFVGEAPGAEEDRRGEPFVGRAGALLDRMIAAMGWTRDTIYIANVLKCRPPGNRDPERDEIESCEPFLARQIRAIAPRIIVTLGRPATHLLLRTNAPISSLRGKFTAYEGIKVMPTFHPAYLLRSPDRKREAWSDLKQVIAELARIGVNPPNPPKA